MVGLQHITRQQLLRFDDCKMLDQPKRHLTVGRCEKTDIRLWDLKVSYMHCTLSRLPDGSWELSDAKSTNGVWVNGVRVADIVLRIGMRVVVGETEFAVMGPDGVIPITARTEYSFYRGAEHAYGARRVAAKKIDVPSSTYARKLDTGPRTPRHIEESAS